MKIRVLFDTETTGAVSGFGKYGRELLKRLCKVDGLEVAELASFGTMEDDKFHHAKWRYYPAAVNPNHPEFQIFESDVRNKYGAWRFDRTVLDFQPHFVVSWKDPWMYEHIFNSPLRPFYNICIMPTFDSAPYQPQWLELLREADSVFTYSDWAIPELFKETNGQVKVVTSTYPGVDLEAFRPMNKSIVRNKLGILQDAIIIGMVARNQRRKLFPELFKMFRYYLDKYGNTDIGKRSYLYLHTSYPDVGWDIPELLNEFGIANRVLFTYIDLQVRQPFIAKFEGARAFSPITSQFCGQFPNVGVGLTEEQLGEVYNLFDIYVQYANCEGSGMPSLEAAACGCPIAAINYSAMADTVEKTNGIPLEPASIPRDADLGADRAVPDNKKAADAIYKFLSLDTNMKMKKSKSSRLAAEKWFNWDITAEKWINHFKNTKLTGLQGQWNAPKRPFTENIPDKIPDGLSNLQFVLWGCEVVAQYPELATKYTGLTWLNDLNNGGNRMGGQVTREMIFEQFKGIGLQRFQAEMARTNLDKLSIPDYIQFAHILEKERNE